MDKIKAFLSWLAGRPVWIRAVLLALIAALLFFLTLSCGQTVKVTVRDTPSGVTVSTSQNREDSASTNINVNPTINFPKNGN